MNIGAIGARVLLATTVRERCGRDVWCNAEHDRHEGRPSAEPHLAVLPQVRDAASRRPAERRDCVDAPSRRCTPPHLLSLNTVCASEQKTELIVILA